MGKGTAGKASRVADTHPGMRRCYFDDGGIRAYLRKNTKHLPPIPLYGLILPGLQHRW